ncbi:hypothetical protein GCM10022214_26230 [Actinomadura miaoliensis]|uniref:Uncharacterized protein n=1 Tax=Actinomadura miaoliensis TaxID=430685 RepID=A0ABP7VM42_9ACTN
MRPRGHGGAGGRRHRGAAARRRAPACGPAPTDIPAVRDEQPPTTPADTDQDTEVAGPEAYVRLPIDPSEPMAVWLAIV